MAFDSFIHISKRAPPPNRILDHKFRDNRWQYGLQCLMATLSIFAVLTVLDAVTQTVLVASLGASSFIAFTMPHVESARPRYLVGGYVIGTIAGCGMSLAGAGVAASGVIDGNSLPLAFAALATGIAIFLMVITNTEHPPAAALALGFALNEWNITTIAVVFIGIVAISAIKEVGKSNMMDLL
ncbi:MAG: HPP family protein [Xanthomonadales bacterium]|nr:HPP family protein [Xanthomonadales bacterium]